MGIAPGETTTSSTTSTGTGGMVPCGVDCTKFETPQCTQAVCNLGQYEGPLNTCIVIPVPDGKACDDGLFCTTDDACQKGTCVGGEQNDCGNPSNPCMAVICLEDTKTCEVTPVNDGTACTPTDLCQVNGVCMIGDCVGEPKDCTFSPLNECNSVACDPTSGKCVGTPDAKKDAQPCLLTGDVCSVDKTCSNGQCGGGVPKDCTALNIGCTVGLCNTNTGICDPAPAPVGTACSDGIPECHVGACDDKGGCGPQMAPDGIACNDHNSCTKADSCTAGTCSGSPVNGCVLYLTEGFENCPSGWTLGGDWQCGKPINVGPPAAHTGQSCIGTQIAGNYTVNQSFNTCTADSPAIDLTKAVSPQVSFWAWDWTEGGSFDGWNLKASIDGGATFNEVMAVTPPYPLMIQSQPAWGGNHATEGWKNYTADLSTFIGHSVILRIAFRSDGATVFPGVYIDDVVVAEPVQLPLFITTTSPLTDVFAGQLYSQQITKTGGDGLVTWSIVPGGTNSSWITINPATGVLSGTPTIAGPVSVTVHVEEQLLPSNFAEKTFTFNVNPDVYYTSFEGACPDGWTLTGDWQCGVPMKMGTNPPPPTAYVGTQCLATQLAGNYHDNDTYAGNTADSPPIDFTGVAAPKLTFRMWVDTEGATYDGFNLLISSDGGTTYTIVNNVMTPPYPLVVANEPAWGGHQGALGWQLVTVDLSAFSNKTVRLRFSFRSDSSGTFTGVLIDDILIN